MDLAKYRRAKIITCSDKDFWYKNNIGETILVKNVSWASAYVEDKQGRSVLRYDIEYIK